MGAEVSDFLLRVYNEQQLPEFRSQWLNLGYTPEALTSNREALFRFLFLAAYDRRPYVSGAGYESIWGIGTSDSVCQRLCDADINLGTASSLSQSDIYHRLSALTFNQYTLNSDEFVDYSRCAKEIATRVAGLMEGMKVCSTGEDVQRIYDSLCSIHGFKRGTIASKIIKYWFREIGVSQVDKSVFPPEVVMPIVKEIHNEKAAEVFIAIDSDFIRKVTLALRKLGDPYAIDALFYLPRKKNEDRWLSQPNAEVRTLKAIGSMIESVVSDNGSWGKTLLRRMEENRQKQGVRGMKSYYDGCILKSSAHAHAQTQSTRGKRTLESEYSKFYCAYYAALLQL